jgi:DNA-binding protein H-NS
LADLSQRAAGKPGKPGSGKVAAKYRNAVTGEAWSGRGLQPRWLKAALASGAKLTDFAV